jgi:hypothetical protein
MGRQLASVRRAQELLLADRTMKSVIAELQTCFGVSSTDAIAAIMVGRALNRAETPTTTAAPATTRPTGTRPSGPRPSGPRAPAAV